MLVRVNTDNSCVPYRFEGGVSDWTIYKSVGLGGANLNDDVAKIQQLLNLIAPADGGAFPPLVEDSFIGKHTIAAIKRFQQQHKTASDSRVDPGGPTLKKMNELPKPGLAEKNAARLARVLVAMPEMIQMADKGQRTIEQAMTFVRLGAGGLSNFQKAFDLANLHFAFGKQPKEVTLTELTFIHTSFQRVRTVLKRRPSPSFGGDPFGVSIFTIDPNGPVRNPLTGIFANAYTPDERAEALHKDPVTSGHVYLCSGLDSKPQDRVAHTLTHELFHFVDDESEERQIVDFGYREKAMQLPHNLRMHNADNFALFSSHIHFGRARLLTFLPTLQPHIPENM